MKKFMTRPKIVVFDKFLGYQVGGAGLSLEKLLENLFGDFKFIGCEVKKSFSAERLEKKDFPVERIKIKEISRFPYLEYSLNRKKIAQFFSKQRGDCLFAQSLWAPIAINNFQGKIIYFIRDENKLNRVPNYYSGLKAFLKKVYILTQYPFIKQFFLDNQKAIEKADLVIANSYFIKDFIKEKFGRESEVIYPMIDVSGLQKIKLLSFDQRPFLTLIGSELIKGRPIVEKIARRMKKHQFMIVGREFEKPVQKKNILYQPWSKQPLDIYRKTRILLIPSLWQEAFCRVAVEGMALGIPCLASNRGGIPEVLDDEFLIKELWDIGEWASRIEKLETNYNNFPERLKNKATKFDAKRQIKEFKRIVKTKFNFEL